MDKQLRGVNFGPEKNQMVFRGGRLGMNWRHLTYYELILNGWNMHVSGPICQISANKNVLKNPGATLPLQSLDFSHSNEILT